MEICIIRSQPVSLVEEVMKESFLSFQGNFKAFVRLNIFKLASECVWSPSMSSKNKMKQNTSGWEFKVIPKLQCPRQKQISDLYVKKLLSQASKNSQMIFQSKWAEFLLIVPCSLELPIFWDDFYRIFQEEKCQFYTHSFRKLKRTLQVFLSPVLPWFQNQRH